MRYLLSIKTVIPKPGGRVWHDDQLEAHDQIYDGDDGIDYAFMGSDPNAADNQWLRAAYENQVGVIYFLGIAPGRYQPIWPVYIADWDAKALKVRRAARCAERIAAFRDSSRHFRVPTAISTADFASSRASGGALDERCNGHRKSVGCLGVQCLAVESEGGASCPR